MRAEARFQAAARLEDVERFRVATNRLATASWSTGAVGVAAVSFGALFYLIDREAGPLLRGPVLR